jgi:glycosyltransferase involved in cell wall biosynthesis
MKILFIVPGSGDPFYCGNCFRDNLQANALRKAGHDVVIMPLYLPLKDNSFLADTPLFFPATSLYLSQKYFRNKSMPRWMEKILNSDFSLNMAASFSGTTSAEGLEDMTLSMIKGDDNVFLRQVHSIVYWIKEHEQSDIIHLSSNLLIGIAKAIKQEIDIPIVCSLQDEEIWIDTLRKEDAEAAWKGIGENIGYIDRFVTTSQFYKQIITHKFPQITNIDVIYPGLETEKYASEQYPADPVIGFFYRMNETNGLHLLVEAFVKLKKENRVNGLKLRIGGGYTSADKKFLKKMYRILAPYGKDVYWCDTYKLKDHATFYKEITAICVPITFPESVGLYLCESFAAGRPAIEPATGSFSETVGDAGVLYEPNIPEVLADAIEKLLTTDGLWEQCRQNALDLSRTRYNETIQAAELYKVYKLARTSAGAGL